MKQQSLGLVSSSKREFLGEMERVVHWGDLVALIAPASQILATINELLEAKSLLLRAGLSSGGVSLLKSTLA